MSETLANVFTLAGLAVVGLAVLGLVAAFLVSFFAKKETQAENMVTASGFVLIVGVALLVSPFFFHM